MANRGLAQNHAASRKRQRIREIRAEGGELIRRALEGGGSYDTDEQAALPEQGRARIVPGNYTSGDNDD